MADKKKYEFLSTATADRAYKSYGSDADELFVNSALALSSVMVDLDTLRSVKKQEFSLRDEKLDGLLLKFLEEIVFVKDAKNMLFVKFTCEVKESKDGWTLKATAFGDKIDATKQKLGGDVKAITYHMFEVKKTKGGYSATVLVDV